MATNKRGTFSRYDPKTQMETVHFQPKTQYGVIAVIRFVKWGWRS